MCSLEGLFANNRAWAQERIEQDPELEEVLEFMGERGELICLGDIY